MKPIDLKLIREADQALDRIAQDHPELINQNSAAWTEEDVEELISNNQPVIILSEAANLLRCHVETLRRAIRAGKLKAARVGREYKISRVDLVKYFVRQGGRFLFDNDNDC
jgi:excisionase family DNA binding protein